MRQKRYFSDFSIMINDECIPCHKLILSAHSPVIKDMLLSEMSEVAKQHITLNHMDIDIMNIILDYMYVGQVSFHQDQLQELIKACEYFQMASVKELCLAHVPDNLKPDNAIS